jgi:hypothetical protein
MLRDGLTPAERATWWALVGLARAWSCKPSHARRRKLAAAGRRTNKTTVPLPRDPPKYRLFVNLVRAAVDPNAGSAEMRQLADQVAAHLGEEPAAKDAQTPWWLEA